MYPQWFRGVRLRAIGLLVGGIGMLLLASLSLRFRCVNAYNPGLMRQSPECIELARSDPSRFAGLMMRELNASDRDWDSRFQLMMINLRWNKQGYLVAWSRRQNMMRFLLDLDVQLPDAVADCVGQKVMEGEFCWTLPGGGEVLARCRDELLLAWILRLLGHSDYELRYEGAKAFLHAYDRMVPHVGQIKSTLLSTDRRLHDVVFANREIGSSLLSSNFVRLLDR